MVQTAKFYLKGENLPAKAKSNRMMQLGLWSLASLVAVYFYLQYLHNLTHPRLAAPRHVASATLPASAGSLGLAAAAPKGTGSLATTNTETLIDAKPAKPSLGDSLLAILTPSAGAETVQPELQPVKAEAQAAAAPAALPAARQPLTAEVPIHHVAAPLTEEQLLLQAAKESLGNALDLASKNPDTYGFAGGERIDLARLGKPLRVYTIAAEDRQSYQEGQPILPLLQATNEWVFPVVLNNQVRFMVSLKRDGQAFVAESSSRSLGMIYQKILDRWPARLGYHPQLVVNPNLADYYFTIPELPNQNLTDTSDMLQYHPTLSPASVILASWR